MIVIRDRGDEETKVRVGSASGTRKASAKSGLYADDFKFLSLATKVSSHSFQFGVKFFFLASFFS